MKKQHKKFNILITAFLLIINILTFKYNLSAGYLPIKLIVGDILLAIFMLMAPFIEKRLNLTVRKIGEGFLLVFSPVYVFVVVELITRNLSSLTMPYILKNLVIYYIIYIFILCCFRKIKNASTVYSTVFVVLALVYHYVLEFRGRPFLIFDLSGISTAFTVAETYSYNVSTRLGVCLQLLIIYFILQFYFQNLQWKKKNILRVLRSVVVLSFCIVCYMLVNTNIKKYNLENIDMWDLK